MSMHLKVLWILLIVTNIAWIVAFRIVDRGRLNESSQRQQIEQQRDSRRSQVTTLTETMSKLCACGK